MVIRMGVQYTPVNEAYDTGTSLNHMLVVDCWQDVVKAYLRGQFNKIISSIKTQTKSWEVRMTEELYIANLTDDTKQAWLEVQSMSRHRAVQLAENILRRGESTGHMLALLARSQQTSSFITAISDRGGFLKLQMADRVFCTFYVDLYSAKVQLSSSQIDDFLDSCSLPCLSTSDTKLLYAPLTDEELSLALKQSHNGKKTGAGRPPI